MTSDAKSPRVRKAIRVALENVERSTHLAPDDPAIVELKHKVARIVGELEIAKAKREDKVIE